MRFRTRDEAMECLNRTLRDAGDPRVRKVDRAVEGTR
jgi:hypothetical protein